MPSLAQACSPSVGKRRADRNGEVIVGRRRDAERAREIGAVGVRGAPRSAKYAATGADARVRLSREVASARAYACAIGRLGAPFGAPERAAAREPRARDTRARARARVAGTRLGADDALLRQARVDRFQRRHAVGIAIVAGVDACADSSAARHAAVQVATRSRFRARRKCSAAVGVAADVALRRGRPRVASPSAAAVHRSRRLRAPRGWIRAARGVVPNTVADGRRQQLRGARSEDRDR